MVAKWDQYRKANPEKQSMVLAQKWKDVIELNNQIRSILQAEGLVFQDELSIPCCVSNRRFTMNMAVGERIRLTKNDYLRGLTNGDLATITSMTPTEHGDIVFTLKMDNGHEVIILQSEYSNEHGDAYFTQAYAMTIYSSQGLTVDGDVFVLYNSGMDRENTYVACSRHKDNC